MEEAPKKVRRHDIDWLRVILFGLLSIIQVVHPQGP